jgi:hypothetical protein
MGAMFNTPDEFIAAEVPVGRDMIQWEVEDCFYVVLHLAFRTFRYDSREEAELAIAKYLETGRPAPDRGRVSAPVPAEPRPCRGLGAMLTSLAATLFGPLDHRVVALIVVALPNGGLATFLPRGWSLALLC